MSYLCKADEVPALSVTSPQLLSELQREDLSLKELSDLLKLDPGLCVRLLHVANSPFFGVSRQISSISEAVIVLGQRQTRALIQVELMRSTLSKFSLQSFPLQQFWYRSLYMAASCQMLAARIGASESAAFTVGIFHNLGVLFMAQYHTGNYLDLLADGAQGADLALRETSVMRVDHGLMGAELLQSWNFPENICDAIALQYHPLLDDGSNVLCSVICMAQILSSHPDWDSFQTVCPDKLFKRFEMCESSFFKLLAGIEKTSSKWHEMAGAL